MLATTPEDADDMPGAELKQEEKQGFIDAVPTRFEVRMLMDMAQIMTAAMRGGNTKGVRRGKMDQVSHGRNCPFIG